MKDKLTDRSEGLLAAIEGKGKGYSKVNNPRKRNQFGYPYADDKKVVPIQPKPTRSTWIDRNRRWIDVGLILSLFLTGSTSIGCVMLLIFIIDTM